MAIPHTWSLSVSPPDWRTYNYWSVIESIKTVLLPIIGLSGRSSLQECARILIPTLRLPENHINLTELQGLTKTTVGLQASMHVSDIHSWSQSMQMNTYIHTSTCTCMAHDQGHRQGKHTQQSLSEISLYWAGGQCPKMVLGYTQKSNYTDTGIRVAYCYSSITANGVIMHYEYTQKIHSERELETRYYKYYMYIMWA